MTQAWSPPSTVPAGATFSLMGGLLIAGGTLLPWYTVTSGLATVNQNGFQLGTNRSLSWAGPALLLLGIVTVVIGVVRLAGGRMPSTIQRSPVVTGLVGGAVLLFSYPVPTETTQRLANAGLVSTSVGYGYWICAVGCGVAVVGGVILRDRRRVRSDAGLKWAVGIVATLLVLSIGALVGFVVSQHSTGTPTTASGTTGGGLTGSAAENAAKAACGLPLLAISDQISLAVEESSVAPVSSLTQGNGLDPLRQALDISRASRYGPLAPAARSFFDNAAKTISTGSLGAVELGDIQLTNECKAVGPIGGVGP